MTNLKPFQLTEFESLIVRPTIADQYLSVPANVTMEAPRIASKSWERMSLAGRIELLENTGIGLDEYMTALNLAY